MNDQSQIRLIDEGSMKFSQVLTELCIAVFLRCRKFSQGLSQIRGPD
jgi:hypothetical protein